MSKLQYPMTIFLNQMSNFQTPMSWRQKILTIPSWLELDSEAAPSCLILNIQFQVKNRFPDLDSLGRFSFEKKGCEITQLWSWSPPQKKTINKWFREHTSPLPPDLQLRPQRHRVLGGVVPQPLPLTPGSGCGRQSRASKHRVRRQGKSPILSFWFPDMIWFDFWIP